MQTERNRQERTGYEGGWFGDPIHSPLIQALLPRSYPPTTREQNCPEAFRSDLGGAVLHPTGTITVYSVVANVRGLTSDMEPAIKKRVV
jgi:hypothetical protein